MSEFLTILSNIHKLDWGICGAITSNSDRNFDMKSVNRSVSNFIKDFFPEWYSGDTNYPIVHPSFNSSYAYYYNTENNNNTGFLEYRQRRYAILEHMKQMSHMFEIKTDKEYTTLEYKGL